ncbi:hypothetical protein LR021_04605 [Candidatus Bipolaricaulota bacterium]|nr:hypothetical protein [Candidatus Bipolaricaulota bacterium]
MVLVLALLIGVGPMYNLIAVASEAQEILPVLPVGEELGDEELAAVEGEVFWFLIPAVLVAGAVAIHQQWFDEDHGIDRDDGRVIAKWGVGAGIGGKLAGTLWAAKSVFLPR